MQEVGWHCLNILMFKNHAGSLQGLHHSQFVDNVGIVQLLRFAFIEYCYSIPAAQQAGERVVKVICEVVVAGHNWIEPEIGQCLSHI